MPPKLNPSGTSIIKVDGDRQNVKDYDGIDPSNQPDKKKYTYFYTKQELELQKAHKRAVEQTQKNNLSYLINETNIFPDQGQNGVKQNDYDVTFDRLQTDNSPQNSKTKVSDNENVSRNERS